VAEAERAAALDEATVGRRLVHAAMARATPRCSRPVSSTSPPLSMRELRRAGARPRHPGALGVRAPLVPFLGTAHVGYLPGRRSLGLSKLVKLFARRPRAGMIDQAGRRVAAHPPAGARCRVVIEAEYLCMTLRGVRSGGTHTTTLSLLGTLRRTRGHVPSSPPSPSLAVTISVVVASCRLGEQHHAAPVRCRVEPGLHSPCWPVRLAGPSLASRSSLSPC
jgi:hypothetical protein